MSDNVISAPGAEARVEQVEREKELVGHVEVVAVDRVQRLDPGGQLQDLPMID